MTDRLKHTDVHMLLSHVGYVCVECSCKDRRSRSHDHVDGRCIMWLKYIGKKRMCSRALLFQSRHAGSIIPNRPSIGSSLSGKKAQARALGRALRLGAADPLTTPKTSAPLWMLSHSVWRAPSCLSSFTITLCSGLVSAFL